MKSSARGRQDLPALAGRLCAPRARNLVWLGLACMPAVAQEATGSRAYYLLPTFNASAQLIDARNRASGASSTELIASLGPGLQLSKQAGAVQGTLSYQLLGTLRSRQPELNTFENSLVASARAEAVPGWMYVDARANVAKQNVAALGQLTAADSLATNSNRKEVLNLQVSPYVRGELRDLAEYELRLTGGGTEVRGSSVGDAITVGSSANISSPRRGTVLGWGVAASTDRTDFKGGRRTDNTRVVASVSARPDPDLTLVARAGQESTNVVSVEQRSFANWGGGLRWTPTPRTVVDVSADKRYFGDSYQLTFEHRFRRSLIRLTSSRDASSSAEPLTLLQLRMRQYQSAEPDVNLRFIRVLQLMSSSGELSRANEVVGSSFATSAVTLQRREELSYTYITPRTNYTLRATSGSSRILDSVVAQSGLALINQRALEASVAHQLTPITSATLLALYQRNSSPNLVSSDLKSLSLNVNTAVNRQTTATLGARFGVYSGASNSNHEAALAGSLSMRF
jgi:uncharacterized protein (PEP-CTERM system associated)